MSFAPHSPPLAAPPQRPRRPRRAPALALLALVLLLHGMLLGGLPRQRPPSARPGPLPAPSLWTRSLPPVADAAPAAAPEAPRAMAVPRAALTPAPHSEAAPAPARRAFTTPSPATAAPSEPAAAPAAAAPSADADNEEPVTATAGGSAPPLYATRLPAPALLRFQLRRGPQRGQAQLVWQPADGRYTIALDAQAGGRPLFEQRSTGRSGPQGLAPERFQDKRRGRAAQQASFDAAGQRVAFSARAPDLPFWPGAQDRLGWIVQLAGIVAAAPAPPDEVQLFVVGARGGAGPWTFVARGAVEVASPLGPVQALHYERAPAVLRDQRVEAWLDPARGYWPIKLRFTPVLGGPPLELLLEGEPAEP
jgi:hypothetical protein